MEWDQEYDVVVVGSGAGGVGATYTAAREGLSVLLVEATDKFGGTTAYSGGGLWYPCNPVLMRSGANDTIEDALTYYQSVVGDRTPRELQEAFVRGGAPLIEYLEQDPHLKFEFEMVPWPDYFGKAPKASIEGHRHMIPAELPVSAAPHLRDVVRGPLDVDRYGTPPPDDTFANGRALIARFLLAIAAYPTAELALNTPLVELVVEDRQVVGAIVERDGRRISVRARKGVLLAAGGFGASAEMRERYATPGSARDTMEPLTNTGSAHKAAIAVGADVDLMDEAWWTPGLTHPNGRSTFSIGFKGASSSTRTAADSSTSLPATTVWRAPSSTSLRRAR